MTAHPLSPAAALASELIQLDTTNPPGGEYVAAFHIAERLRAQGLSPVLQTWDEGRTNLVCTLPGEAGASALLLSGHLDTVALGSQQWSVDPFGATIDGDRIYGRGSTDMKGGVAAMVVAFERLANTWSQRGTRPIVLALTASEETGCQGAQAVLPLLPAVGAMVVGEATGNHVGIGHKGVMWARLLVDGRAAHASRPELGDNAVTNMARVITAVDDTSPVVDECPLGPPTITPTLVRGGAGRNIVPDGCECTLDIRLTTTFGTEQAHQMLQGLAASSASCHTEVDLVIPPVLTSTQDPWLRDVAELVGHQGYRTATYFTDASVLAPALGDPPVCILGPGEASMAHQVDEWCSLTAIDESADIYQRISEHWCAAANHDELDTHR
jgi:succinyl-diaminopimelate desuccinylase